jgi:hypothetical protein
MPYTVRLCRDLAGWFASMSDDIAGYPGAIVQWESAFDCPDRAMSVLEVAQDLAQRLVGGALPAWGREPGSAHLRARPLAALVAGGGLWASHHYEAGRFLVVAQVSHDQNGHSVRLTDARGHSEAVIYYPTRQAAFQVADDLVRIRNRGHVCGRACSSWAEEASAEEARPPG